MSRRRTEATGLEALAIYMDLETIGAIPPECDGCEENANPRCREVAREVGKGALTRDEAIEMLSDHLKAHCAGRITRPGGWGTRTIECRHDGTPIDITLPAQQPSPSPGE